MSGVRVLVGTRKGAFILRSDGQRKDWDVSGPFFGGCWIWLTPLCTLRRPASASKTSTRNLSIRRQCCSCGSRRTIRCSTATNVLHE